MRLMQQMLHYGRMKKPTSRNTPRSGDGSALTYRQKHRQANREALYTVIALAATIIAWTALGFGLSDVDIVMFHTPLWVLGGTIGTWVFAICVTVVLAKKLFKNFDLGDEAAPSAVKPPLAGAHASEEAAIGRRAGNDSTAASSSSEAGEHNE